MPLRGAGDVGVPDVRRFSALQVTDGDADARPVEPAERLPAANERPARHAGLAAVPTRHPGGSMPETPAAVAPSALEHIEARALLGDERLVHIQADVPDATLQRVKLVSFEIAAAHPHLRRHQTILGALIWAHVDHTDQRRLDELADLVDAYGRGPWHGLPEVRRLSARLPASLKRRVEGTVLALAGTHRDASAKALVAALVWQHVVSAADDEVRFARLVDAVGGYHQEVSQRSLTAPVANATGVL